MRHVTHVYGKGGGYLRSLWHRIFLASCEFHQFQYRFSVIFILISMVSLSGFQFPVRCYTLILAAYNSCKHRNWWRHKLGHTWHV